MSYNLRQHRTIPALRLKHRSGSCGTASALPKCSIMSGCGTRIVLRGAKAPRTLRPLPLLRFAVSATGGAHLCSIQYYLRFWLSICRTSLAVSALRIMWYCLKSRAESPDKNTNKKVQKNWTLLLTQCALCDIIILAACSQTTGTDPCAPVAQVDRATAF